MTSKSYVLPETPITFLASGGDVTFTQTSVASGAGRQSAQHDFGAAARAFAYKWRAWVKFATTPVVGETVDFYLKTSDGTHSDNDDGTTDAAVSSEDKLSNLRYIKSIIVDEASSTPEFSASGEMVIYDRYAQVVMWNASEDDLSSTAADHGFSLTPIPVQGQDS